MTPPVFRHGDLRLYLLKLLDERPMHGYDVIAGLAERSGGTYTPSAGTVYPRLAKLQEEGLVSTTKDGRRTVYALTEAGRAELAARGGELDQIVAELDDSVRRLADEVRASVQDAMRTLRADLAAAGREASSRPEPAAADDDRGITRERLREAETALAEFRAELRTELRGAAAESRLPAETIALLSRGLLEVRRQVVRSLREA